MRIWGCVLLILGVLFLIMFTLGEFGGGHTSAWCRVAAQRFGIPTFSVAEAIHALKTG
jgi:hypothetical protein